MKRLAILAFLVANLVQSAAAYAGAESATLVVSGSYHEGGTVTYQVTIANTVDAAQADLPGHEFSVLRPAGIRIIPGTLTTTTGGPAYDAGAGAIYWDGQLGAQRSVTVTFSATIDAGTAGTTITMQGVAEYASDFDGGLIDVLTDDPQLPGNEDPTSFVVAPATPVTLRSFDVD